MLYEPRHRATAAASLALALLLLPGLLPAQSATSTNTTSPPISTQQLEEAAAEKGYSLSELRRLGIDPSRPEQAIERARQLGIPESQIQQYIEEGKGKAKKGEGVPGAQEGLILGEVVGEAAAEGIEEEAALDTTEADTLLAAEMDSALALDTALVVMDTLLGTGRFEGLYYFGYGVIRSARRTVTPLDVGPVDPGYVISTDDVLRLYLWGDVEFQYELPVQKDGTVMIPRAGQVLVAGTQMQDLRARLQNYLSKFYSGLRSDPPTTFMDVNLARVGSNHVYLMGEALRPGSYSISSYATAFNLMYATGGPRSEGSLRNIRILRGGEVVATVDFYDYLLKGTSTEDRRLQDNDIVFLPPRTSTVGIEGEVLRPAIYETTDEESLRDLIAMAGGLAAEAYGFRCQIDRIVPMDQRERGESDHVILDVDLVEVMAGRQEVPLYDGDLVSVFDYTDRLENYVDLEGTGVMRPGRYQLDSIDRVAQLIQAAEGLTGSAYTLKADIVRVRQDDTREFLSFSPAKALDGDPRHNLELMPEDSVRIYAREDWEPIPLVHIRGNVAQQGTYQLADNMTLYDALFAYSGLQDTTFRNRTYMDRGNVYRLLPDGRTRKTISFVPADVMNQVPGSNFVLQHDDIVALFPRKVREPLDPKVSLSGAVNRPGSYPLTEAMTLADLLLLGQGFTQDAWLLEAEVSRVPISGIPGDRIAEIIRVPITDWSQLGGNPADLISPIFRGETEAAGFLLQPFDQVRVRRNPDFQLPGNVQIQGEVTFPGFYTLSKSNETLSELINRAGGLKPSAHAGGGQLYRANARVYLDFEELLVANEEREDVILQPGDRVVIPRQPNTVTVMGEVVNPGIYKYLKGEKVRDYLDAAGGKSDNGGRAFVRLPSGRTYELTWLTNPKVKDGSVIRVLPKPPEKESEPIDWSSVLKDALALAASAMTVVVLASRVN